MKWEFVVIIITATITSAISTIFSYYKEKKFASSKYTQRVLEELYIPIYKVLKNNNHGVMGYMGINYNQLNEVKMLIEDKPELCDPKLERIINIVEEDLKAEYGDFFESEEFEEDYYFDEEYYIDKKNVLKNYVFYSFNRTRKSLGLPSDYFYVYPFLLKLGNMRTSIRSIKRKWKWKYKRTISRIKSGK